MRIFLSILALACFTATASAQSATTEKKARSPKKAEAVTAAPDEAAPKAGCCAGKASASSCAAKAEAKTAEAAPAPAATGSATLEAAPAAEQAAAQEHGKGGACCAGKAKTSQASCHGKAEAHSHDVKTEEAPAEK